MVAGVIALLFERAPNRRQQRRQRRRPADDVGDGIGDGYYFHISTWVIK